MSQKYITTEQKEIMLEFIKARPKLHAGKFSPDFTMVQARTLWQELAAVLNSHPNVAKKEWNTWRKCWIDIKKNSKAKVAKEKKYQRDTGGGPPIPVTTDSFDNKVMELSSPVCVAGNMEVPEPSIVFDQEILFDGIVLSNDQLETVEPVHNIELDHAYFSPSNESQQCSTEPHSNEVTNLRKKLVSKIPTQPRGKCRVTKTMRLNESIKNHSKMVDIAERGKNRTKAYRFAKLEV